MDEPHEPTMRDRVEAMPEPLRRTFLNVASDMDMPLDDPQFNRRVEDLLRRIDPKRTTAS